MSDTTDFGYQRVSIEEKASKVAEVFHSVANKYDLMNDLMSLGAHRVWKRFAVEMCGIRPHHQILDVAGGTGDLTKLFVKKLGDKGRVVLSDINDSMLAVGRDRLLDQGVFNKVEFVQADAERLPFDDNSFDCVSIAFGLRNVTHKETALKSMYRVLKPGGRLIVLEFSKPVLPMLDQLYDLYSFNIIPKLGQWVTGDSESYQYLVESIRKHPDQETLKLMMQEAGFESTEYFNLTGGVVALHRGYKL